MENKPNALSVDTTKLISPLLAGATRRGLDEVITLEGVVAAGGMGRIYRASNLNPFALLAELVINGELSPTWVGLSDVHFDEPGPDDLPEPILEPRLVKRVYQGADRMKAEYEQLKLEQPDTAERNRRDLLALINPRLAQDPAVAVKVLQPVLSGNGDDTTRRKLLKDQTRRFIRENHILRCLDHVNIVSRFGLVYDPGRGWCLLLAYIDGENLEERLARQPDGKLPLNEAVRIGLEVAEGLRHVHDRKVIHRDIKPSNIMVDRAGRAIITDFGIGRWESTTVTITNSIVGTLDYLSPEQLDGRSTPATDVYQLGTMLFRMVTGHLPYENFDQAPFFSQLSNLDLDHPTFVRPLRPEISPALETIIEVARRKREEQRWTLDELIAELRELASTEGGDAPAGDRARLQRRLKTIAWERDKIETRLQVLEIEERLEAVDRVLAEQHPAEALSQIEVLLQEVQGLSSRFNTIKARVLARRQAIAQSIPQQEIRILLDAGDKLWTAAEFVACGALLKEIEPQVAALPPGSWPDLVSRMVAQQERYKPHASAVELFETLQKSLVNPILDQCLDLNREAAAGRTVPQDRIEKVLKELHAAVGMLKSIDRTRIGVPYLHAARELADRWMELKRFADLGETPAHFDSADARTTVRSWIAQCRLALESLRDAT